MLTINYPKTISCLLIYPNPDSALNSAAGALLQEDYDAFARQAKLMTSIHAPVPTDMKNAVTEAKSRGEDVGTVIQEQQQEESSSLRPKKGTRVQSVTMKKKTSTQNEDDGTLPTQPHASVIESEQIQHSQGYENPPSIPEDDDDENNENDPSLSPSPVKFAPPSPRKSAHGKRPLSVLTMPMEDPFITTSTAASAAATTTTTAMETDEEGITATTQMTASEKNIAANQEDYDEDYSSSSSSQRKSPKLSILNKGTNSSGRIRDDIDVDNIGIGIGIFEDGSSPDLLHRRTIGDGKENQDSSLPTGAGSKEPLGKATRKQQPNYNHSNNNTHNTSNNYNNPSPSAFVPSASISSSTSATPAAAPSSSKGRGKPASSSSSSTGTRKVSRPRVGIRRL